MATQSEVVRHSDLLNQLVLDLNTMEELGRIEVLWMHPAAHRVLGFICKSGVFGNKKTAFNLAQIKTLGANGILVNAKPVETDNSKVRQLESLLNCEVWSDVGNKIGIITDYLFHLKTGDITQYLFVPHQWGGLASGVYLLPPSKILSFGSKRVLVAAAAVPTLSLEREGIKQKLTKVGVQVTQDWQALAKQAQLKTQGTKERTQALAEQANQKVQILSDRFKQNTQNWVEQVKEQAQSIGEQVKENSQTLTEQTKQKLNLAVEKNPNFPPTPPSASQNKVTESSDPAIVEDDDEPWI